MMVKYWITYEAYKDRFFPGVNRTCKYVIYRSDELTALAQIAYNDYRSVLARLKKGRETIIFFDKHPSPYFSLWVRRGIMWIDPEPVYEALFTERVLQTRIHIPEINTGKPGCSIEYHKLLLDKYKYKGA